MPENNLNIYNKKRDFSKTLEPKGKINKKHTYRYLIQKHDARRLHYDLRLELDGVLKSWAVTKGPSLDPNDKRLAVEVEDHPIKYKDFEGTIPHGLYGGGTVMLWDEGYWEPINDPHKGLHSGKLEFILHGKRLKGQWTLIRMKSQEKRTNWLLIKYNDDVAQDNDYDNLLKTYHTSVRSHKSMDEIAQNNSTQNNKKQNSSKIFKKKLPKFIAPQLATLSNTFPEGSHWIHEIKFDGYRIQTHFDQKEIIMFNRTGLDWTHKFRFIADKLSKLPIQTAILDGEIIVPDTHGISSFKMLQETLSQGQSSQFQYYIFDLLYLNGHDLTSLPLIQRKELLNPLLKIKTFENSIFYSDHFVHHEQNFLKKVCNLKLEGIISKRKDASYKSGRNKDWLKTKCHLGQEFIIGGFTLPKQHRHGIGALFLGYYRDQKLIYAGKVGTGFDQETSILLRKKLNLLLQKNMPFDHVPTQIKKNAYWVQPKLVCEVTFTEWTGNQYLRHPSFQGLRADKPASSITRDIALEQKKSSPKLNKKKSTNTTIKINGIEITHPNRIIYPDFNITKQELADYYSKIADYILPYIINRPLSIIRCPENVNESCFFQRHIPHDQSPYLYDTGIKIHKRNESYLMIKDIKGLISLVQLGVIEFHPWGCYANQPDKPNWIIFDLDPDPSLNKNYVIKAAQEIRERMHEFGLKSFVKMTGGKGLHVTIPIKPKYNWDTIKAFTKAIAQSMAYDKPNFYTARASKTTRKNKIFVDYLRNDYTSTAVAPFSVRARNIPTIALPCLWEDLKRLFLSEQMTIKKLSKYLINYQSDPWEDFFKIEQTIHSDYLQALAIDPK
ncbi:MAG: DNA ligase D [Alphaproteobacteria bacterium]|nr:DNA ligase D [Alphaproteobacteria bacterium]